MTPPRIVVMGVAGSGKSAIGARLATALGVPFLDADDLHPLSNVAKMTAGIPLEDDDRWPWLDAVGAAIAAGAGGVVACSALRFGYRERLRASVPGLVFVHLEGSAELLAARIGARANHFMPSALLHSQLAALEPLRSAEAGFGVDIAGDPDELAREIAARIGQLA
ncbi:MAG TPA: gluconokinase [Galbitalea sp.]